MRFLLPILALSLLGILRDRARSAEQVRPNVIVIFTDDLGYGDLGCYGATEFGTPRIDRMSAEGMRFTDFYVAASVCSASRAALLTGRYPVRTGVTGVISANSKTSLPLAEETLAERFKKLGYATAIIGKWHLGNTPDVWALRQGFDEWFGTVGSNDMGKGRPTLEERRAGKAGVELVENETVIEVNPDQTQLTRRYTRRAVDFIQRKKDGPFFLYLPHNMPHTPIFASKEFAGGTRRGLYGDVVAEIDWSVGEIVAALKRAKIDERTIVMFTSDNGPWLIFGNHGGSAGSFAGGKKQTLEGGMRVPMIIRWPGRISAGMECRKLVTALDLTPTLLALVGTTIDKSKIDGRDVSPWLLQQDEAKVPDKPFFFFWKRELRAVRSGRWKLQLEHIDHQTPDPNGVGNGGKRGAVMKVSRPQALFDLQADPGETMDVSKRHGHQTKELHTLADAGKALADGHPQRSE